MLDRDSNDHVDKHAQGDECVCGEYGYTVVT